MRINHAWNIVAGFFGNTQNAEVVQELRALVVIVRDCASKLKPGLKMSLVDIVEAERRADKVHLHFNAAVEKAFILRATLNNKPATIQLGHELDDMIDGMRDVAQHIDTFQKFLPELPEGSGRLIAIVEESAELLMRLSDELANGRIDLEEMKQIVEQVSRLEREADEIKNEAQKTFVDTEEVGDFRLYLARSGLIGGLESITDHAKHCAIMMLSMARQEA